LSDPADPLVLTGVGFRHEPATAEKSLFQKSDFARALSRVKPPGARKFRLCPTGNSHMAAMRKLPVVLFGHTISVLPKYPNQ
jgi:hypothetical protein